LVPPNVEREHVGDPSGRYAAFAERLVESVLGTPCHTASELRRAVLARAARLGGRGGRAGTGDGVPASLAAYLDKVALHAYRVTDDDVAALQRAGNSDDALFEVTVAAALGAAFGRLERGLAALRGEEPD
jgi:alkylhydroperoxidase family enzyme